MKAILITIDCWRSDRLEWEDANGLVTPQLDRLKRAGGLFPNTVTAADSTDPSHASILTSTHPPVHGVTQNGVPLGSTPPTLSEVLSQAGFRTMGAVSVEHLSSYFGFARGFQDYSNSSRFDALFHRAINVHLFGFPLSRALAYVRAHFPCLNTHWRPAQATNAHVLPWLQRHADRDFFVWIHYFDPHNYESEEGYNAQLRTVDKEIGRIIALLEKKHILEDTLLVITGDHGESFGEHGYHGHANAALYDEEIIVPLLLHWPASFGAQVLTNQVRTIDIAPTILACADLIPPPTWQGVNLIPFIDGSRAPTDLPASCYSNPVRLLATSDQRSEDRRMEAKCLRVDGWKLYRAREKEDRLFNLKVDPQEMNNLATEKSEKLRDMKAAFFDLETPGQAAHANDDELITDLLRDLGYID